MLGLKALEIITLCCSVHPKKYNLCQNTLMQKLLIAFTYSLFISTSFAQDKGPAKYWFKVLPEEQSLRSFGSAYSRELKAESLRALIWNIKKSSMLAWHGEFRKFSSGRDLILVQEGYANPYFKTILATFFNYRWDMGVSFLYRRDNNTATGTLIGSTAEATETMVLHSPDNEPVVETPKALTVAKYPVKGKADELLVISVHGINFQTTTAFKRHMDRAFDVIKDHVGPILFGGDFNTWNNSRTNYLYRLCKKYNLHMVKFKNGHHRLKFNGYFLDHTFVRGIEIKEALVIGDSKGSDHKPLLIEMDIL